MTKNNFNITTRVTAGQLGLFFELIPVAISITTLQTGEFVFVNKYFEKLFVCKRKDILEKKQADLTIFSQESRLNLNQKIAIKGVTSKLNLELTLLNSKKINALIAVEKIDLDNQQFYITTFTDVTEKTKSTKEIKILNKELGFQHQEKSNRAKELGIANIELAHQQSEKFNRESELIIANKELSYQDNEKLKRAEELIQKNQQLLEAQSLGQFGSWDWDITSNKLECSDELYRIYGLEPSGIELTCSNFIEQIYIDDRIYVKNSIKKAYASKRPFSINHRVQLAGNSIREIRVTGKAYVDSNKKIIRMSGIAQDVSEKKQAQLQAYSRSLIEASRDPLLTISPQGKITDVNQATIRATGIAQADLIGSYFYNYFTEPEKAKKIYEEVFTKGFVVDYPLVLKDQQLTDVLFNGSVYKDENDQVIGAVVVARDITNQKKLEQELVEAKVFAELATSKAEVARRNAEEAVKSKQQFLSNMSHEIRTPMNAIIGFTKVVLKTDLSAKQKEYLTAIKISGDALIVLINDILDLAKVDSGKMTFEKAPFKLALSVSSMLHLFKEKIQEKNLHLITKYDAKIPEVLLGDTVRLNQIILNLVSNAVKFTHKGKITVAVNMLSQDKNNVKIKFSVVDTGIGIKSTKVGEIFENFQQANNTTSRLYGGTGLGLAIVKQLVEAQGGTIELKSKENKGSTFTFVLDFEKSNIVSVLEPEIVEFNTDVKNVKILVVEDMELNQLLMKTLLDDFGFECEIASNGKLAIEKLRVKTFDIILMDLQMPEMNGLDATEYIRKKMKLTIPIIALTADVTTVDVEKCKSAGMNDYIAKPVDERLLYSKLISFSKKPVVIIEHTKGQSASTDTVRYVDMTYLQKLTKSDSNLMSQLIKAYLKQTPPLVNAMKQSLVDKDWKALQAAVHKIIPSFSIIGLSPDIHQIAKRIQEYAFSIEISEEIHKLVHELENVCEQSCVELELELIKLKK